MTRHLSHNENINIAGTFIDIGQLKAFSTVALPDSTWAYVEDIGEYFFNPASSEAESSPDILSPNSGSGRWYKKAVSSVSDYNLIKQITGKFSSSGGTLSGPLTLNAAPTLPLHAVNKQYADNLITGITWKNACKAATVANITLSGTPTVDGIALIAGDRVLVKNQSAAAENGIYTVAAGSWTRAEDVNTDAELETATVFIEQGTINKNTQWTCTSTNVSIGSSAITFGQISGAGTYTAGAGLQLTGGEFKLDAGYFADGTRAGLLSSADWSKLNSAFVNGGNAFGANAVIGTTDASSLIFKTANVARVTIDTAGNAVFGGSTASVSLNDLKVLDNDNSTYKTALSEGTVTDVLWIGKEFATTDIISNQGANSRIARFAGQTGAANYLEFRNSTTNPEIILAGTSTNIGVNVKLKGNGKLTLNGATTNDTQDSIVTLNNIVASGGDSTIAHYNSALSGISNRSVIRLVQNDSLGAATCNTYIWGQGTTLTSGAAQTKFGIDVMIAGTRTNVFNIDGANATMSGSFQIYGTSPSPFSITGAQSSGTVRLNLIHSSASSSSNYLGIHNTLKNTGGTDTVATIIFSRLSTTTAGSEVGELSFRTLSNGTITDKLILSSTSIVMSPDGGNSPTVGVRIERQSSLNYTSGSASLLTVGNTIFNAASGNGNFNSVNITSTINQTSSANGAIRGIYYNPAITSILGTHYAFESSSGDILVGGTGKYLINDGGTTRTALSVVSGNNLVLGNTFASVTVPSSFSMKDSSSTVRILFQSLNADSVNLGTSFNKLNILSPIVTLINETSAVSRGFTVSQSENSAASAVIRHQKSRGTNASPSNVTTGDIIGTTTFSAYVGSAFTNNRSFINSFMDSTSGQALCFVTGTANDNYTPSMLISSSGMVGIGNFGTVYPTYSISSPTALLDLSGSNGTRSSFRIRSGTAPSAPNDGDIWFDNTNLYIRINGTTKTFNLS